LWHPRQASALLLETGRHLDDGVCVERVKKKSGKKTGVKKKSGKISGVWEKCAENIFEKTIYIQVHGLKLSLSVMTTRSTPLRAFETVSTFHA
jgi:hypothetical protein